MKALSVEVWGVYVSLVLRDENFEEHLGAVEDFEGVEEKTCLKDGAWLTNARAQVTCKQSYRSQSHKSQSLRKPIM